MALFLKGQPILLVEDEPLIALDVAEAFERVGGQVITAHSLRQALEMLGESDWSAAVLDYQLGDGNCLPVSNWLMEHDVPFIVLSGYEEPEGIATSSIILSKPVDGDTVVSAVENLADYNMQSRRKAAFTIQ